MSLTPERYTAEQRAEIEREVNAAIEWARLRALELAHDWLRQVYDEVARGYPKQHRRHALGALKAFEVHLNSLKRDRPFSVWERKP